MLKMVQEGKLDVFLKCEVIAKAGTLVKADTAKAGYVVPAGVGEDVIGMLAQDVVERNVDNFKLDSVTHVAYKGEKVGVYFDGGQYFTDMTANNVTFGAKLYAGAGGKLTTTASGNVVAIAEGTADSGKKVLIRFKG